MSNMKTFVIAMDCEAETVTRHLAGLKEETLYGRRVVRGTLNGEDTAVVVSGIGKGNAAAATQLALQLSGGGAPVLNLGVAGAVDGSMGVGDLYEVSEAVQYDFDLTELNGTEMGTLNERTSPYIPCAAAGRLPAKILGSGDRFNDSAEDNALLRRLGIGLRDMEGGAIAHVCERAGVPCSMWKCVSDVHGSGATPEQYKENLAACLERLAALAATL